jgi:hypothetical protein
MENMKAVGVKNLKNNLSLYLREVKRGSRILITDREEVVAELREPLPMSLLPLPKGTNSLLVDWIRRSKLRLPLQAKGKCPSSPLCFAAGTAGSLVDQDRNE